MIPLKLGFHNFFPLQLPPLSLKTLIWTPHKGRKLFLAIWIVFLALIPLVAGGIREFIQLFFDFRRRSHRLFLFPAAVLCFLRPASSLSRLHRHLSARRPAFRICLDTQLSGDRTPDCPAHLWVEYLLIFGCSSDRWLFGHLVALIFCCGCLVLGLFGYLVSLIFFVEVWSFMVYG